jgi:hypothetical protein
MKSDKINEYEETYHYFLNRASKEGILHIVKQRVSPVISLPSFPT